MQSSCPRQQLFSINSLSLTDAASNNPINCLLSLLSLFSLLSLLLSSLFLSSSSFLSLTFSLYFSLLISLSLFVLSFSFYLSSSLLSLLISLFIFLISNFSKKKKSKIHSQIFHENISTHSKIFTFTV